MLVHVAKNSPRSLFKTILYTSIITGLVSCVVFLALLVSLPIELASLGAIDPNSVAIANPVKTLDSQASIIVGKLVRNGTLINIKDLWSFQTSFYQTIITFLIAINGLIAALSVLYIKSSSEEKAEEITKKYMSSEIFDLRLQSKVKNEAEVRLKEIQNDFNAVFETYERSVEGAQVFESQLDKVNSENITIRQQLKVISERIAELDISEHGGMNLHLTKQGNVDGIFKKI